MHRRSSTLQMLGFTIVLLFAVVLLLTGLGVFGVPDANDFGIGIATMKNRMHFGRNGINCSGNPINCIRSPINCIRRSNRLYPVILIILIALLRHQRKEQPRRC